MHNDTFELRTSNIEHITTIKRNNTPWLVFRVCLCCVCVCALPKHVGSAFGKMAIKIYEMVTNWLNRCLCFTPPACMGTHTHTHTAHANIDLSFSRPRDLRDDRLHKLRLLLLFLERKKFADKMLWHFARIMIGNPLTQSLSATDSQGTKQ